MNASSFIHIHTGELSVLLDAPSGRPPAITYWGKDLGSLNAEDAAAVVRANVPPIASNALDEPIRAAIIAQHADGWAGRPSVIGSRLDGSAFSPSFQCRAIHIDPNPSPSTPTPPPTQLEAHQYAHLLPDSETAQYYELGPSRIDFDLTDPHAELDLTLTVEVTAQSVLRMRAKLTNCSSTDYRLEGLNLTAPLPPSATEILDFAGRWGKERVPQRREITVGTHLRENRRGRTGADSAYLLHAGTPGFNFSNGQIWAMHVAWSGNHTHYLERTHHGDQVLGGGELLLAGEGHLSSQENYLSPWIYFTYGEGLDEVAHHFHRHLRARSQHPNRPRPVTLNVWEAVYFNQDLEKLKRLATLAASVGVERYVLDDGWFGSRRNDLSGLGDWVVSRDVWPDGLDPLINHVKSLGMEFGLWFEPEMVNEDSDVARAHPEWIMATGSGLPTRARFQQVLNLSIPEAYAHVRDQMVAILDRYDIAYIKWDHNRDLVNAGTQPVGNAATHAQTLATYRLLDELKQRYPGLEIESCSSGGGRVDLEILSRCERIWVSDCIDPLERQTMNRWTAQLIPFEMMGSHIASGASHTTGRLHCLSFRAASALFGHLGIEWDLERASDSEMSELSQWIELYKRYRELICSGRMVRADGLDESLWLTGVVAPHGQAALYTLTCMHRSTVSPRGRICLPGLNPDRRYQVNIRVIGDDPSGFTVPAWAHHEPMRHGVSICGGAPIVGVGRHRPQLAPLTMTGSALGKAGLMAPLLAPEQSILIEVTALE